MKRSLLLTRSAVSILLLCLIPDLNGQSVIFSEDFSGFTTCSHSDPSPKDVSGELDKKTLIPGWMGFKIYSAGGEIKLGTSDVTGWIETPLINLSEYEGNIFLRFDISRWPDDATSVQVFLNGSPLGTVVIPTNEFQTIELPLSDGTASGKIKFESLAKRFYLDNIQIVVQNITSVSNPDLNQLYVRVYPNPARDIINIDNLVEYSRLEILNISGRTLKVIDLPETDKVEVCLSHLLPGIYILKFVSGRSAFTMRLVKY